jgi:hypothetical protein
MDNIQICDSYVNVPSSQTFRTYQKLAMTKSFFDSLTSRLSPQILIYNVSKGQCWCFAYCEARCLVRLLVFG